MIKRKLQKRKKGKKKGKKKKGSRKIKLPTKKNLISKYKEFSHTHFKRTEIYNNYSLKGLHTILPRLSIPYVMNEALSKQRM